jgi:hypothetical protein
MRERFVRPGRPYSWLAVARPSRMIFAAAVALLPLAAGVARAQDTSRTAAMDSLLARLRALESSVEVLQKQVAEQAGSAVQTHSRMQSEITGRIVINAFSNERGVNNVDNPQFVRRDAPPAVPLQGFGMAARQTMLGLRTTMSDVAGATLRGVMDVDFYGGQQPSAGGRTFPLLRLRTAHAALKWPHVELLAGQEIPLFSPVNPISPAAFGTPEYVAAGNLWLWLPQVRLSVDAGNAVKFGLQGAVLAPTSGDAVAAFDTDFDAAERSRRPYLESRARMRWGEFETEREIGCAVHIGWVTVPTSLVRPDSSIGGAAFGCDARLPLTTWLELRGEGYTGKLTRGLGGGAIGQGITASGKAVRNDAGWAQLNIKPLGAIWSGGFGCGADNPRDEDLPADITTRTRNTSCAVYAVLRPAGPTFIGAEVRRLDTRYPDRAFKNHHLNLAMGFEF